MEPSTDLSQKAIDIFKVCDPECKGFITKRDMHRLQGGQGGDALAGLSPDQLDQVFDLLDKDRNGYLTLDELKMGFVSAFLGTADETNNNIACAEEQIFKEEEEDEEQQFHSLLENLGAQNLFRNEKYVKSLWQHFRNDDVTLMHHFEAFLQKVVRELRRTQQEYTTLESALKNRSNMHDKEIRRLYEEMEHMMKTEREQITTEERSRERRQREELEEELHNKEKELQQLLDRQSQMEKEVKLLNAIENETKLENNKLIQERDLLAQRLESSERLLDNTKSNLDTIRTKELDSRRQRAKAALRVSEGIALEREGLVRQLDILRSVNRELVDEKDSRVTSNEESLSTELGHGSNGHVLDPEDITTDNDPTHRSRFSARSGSIMSDYFNGDITASGSVVDECEVDDTFFAEQILPLSARQKSYSPSLNADRPGIVPESTIAEYEELKIKPQFRSRRYTNLNYLRYKQKSIEETTGEEESIEDTFDSDNNQHFQGEWKVKRRINSDTDGDTQESWKVKLRVTPYYNSLFLLPRDRVSQDYGESQCSECSSGNPERLYKVVFIGDSGVGKSSFINRFCNDDFRNNFSATIGVDFQVKSVTVDGHVVALQLWDTAGQERFRSITKQYYRKADGVIIMFDVTSESSFRNVRNWMTDVKSGADENTVVILVGNKVDQCLLEKDRVVKSDDGHKQAQDFDCLYFETSAKSGEGVQESILTMSALLQEREDEVMERALRLQDQKRKKKCC